ncbi:MAG TPA: enolase C-terminal domain-like protein [Bryobacteraceae bacterium]|nr:enolase C-terminal domain-like protein [Bryobacteraceae bacterium]
MSKRMDRRGFLSVSTAASLAACIPAHAFQVEKSRLKITRVRLVNTRPKRPVPIYTPAPNAWSANGVEVASPMSIYPEYKAKRSLFMPDPGKVPSFTVEVATDRGVKGYGNGGPGGGAVVEQHLEKLLLGEDPFNVERIWDIMWRSTEFYGRTGVTMNAISGVDLAIWDVIGKALGTPVYKLIGGATKQRIPAYCTANDIEQHVQFGFKRLKVAIPKGPADGREGMKVNEALVKRTRELLGPDGDVMIDCWMSWTERYTIEMAEMLAPYRVYWMEECLPPYDYEGFGRLNAQIKSTRIATGEHIYGRYEFRQLLEHNGAEIWQPDIHWCGGLTEIRKIAALAAAYDTPVIPHVGGTPDCLHFIMATPNAPWAELFMPPPGGPPEVYRRWEEDNHITRGPEGVYTVPSDEPGLGWDFEVA